MYKVNIYTYVEPASTRKSKKKYAYLLSCVGKENRQLIGVGTIEGTYHEANLKAINKGLARLNQSCEVNLHCEDSFVLNMFEYNLPRWAARGYQTAKGETIANAEDWMEMWRLTRAQKVIPIKGEHEKKQELRRAVKR